jgi:hypothetical protein
MFIRRAASMKIAVCIQAQDTGRILFIKERQIGPDVDWGWTWPETKFHFNWHGGRAIDHLRSQVHAYTDVKDLPMEWFTAKGELHIIHLRVAEEQKVYMMPGEWQWCSLFEFPEKIHPFIIDATSDLLFLNSLVTSEP